MLGDKEMQICEAQPKSPNGAKLPGGESESQRSYLGRNNLQLFGWLLFLVALWFPSCISTVYIDEFRGPIPGFICAIAALMLLFDLRGHHFWLAAWLTGWVNPLALLYVFAGRISKWKFGPRLQPLFALGVVTGLIASRVALAEEHFRPLVGYYLWVLSMVAIISPEAIRVGHLGSYCWRQRLR